MKEQTGHTCDVEFTGAGPTITFMEHVHKWFALMDVSNCTQHLAQKNPLVRQYCSVSDDRLIWLETEFLDCMHDLRVQSPTNNFLTRETFAALAQTTKSNIQCVRYLLEDKQFAFVLTRKFSSDQIEALFGFLRRSAGCHDQLDVKSAVTGLETILKIGIV